jgi:hypothetical protein
MCLLQHLSHMQSEERCLIRSANLGPGPARPQPLAGLFYAALTPSFKPDEV